MFEHKNVNIAVLRERAYNLRWATQEEGVIPLTAADPDFPCAMPIRDAISAYTEKGYFCYGPPEGLPQFKESLALFFYKKRNIKYEAKHLLPVDSAAYGIHVVCKAFLDKGDEAIIFDPVDFLFRHNVEDVGGVAIPYRQENLGEELDFNYFESLITPKTKLICLCNPLNPTGKVFSATELRYIGALAIKYNLFVLSDEIWSDIVFEPHKFISIASVDEDIKSRVLVVGGFSKSYGLAGLRIGYIAAPNETLFQKVLAASGHTSTVHGANTLAQVAAQSALDDCDEWLGYFLDHLHLARATMVNGLNEIPGFSCHLPASCYVAFPSIKETGKSSSEIQALLLEKAKVAVVPGLPQWFGGAAQGHIRLCFATSIPIIEEALSRIKQAIEQA